MNNVKAEQNIESKQNRNIEDVKRSELLFFYDARMCNPNGDTEENKPRYDEECQKVQVTEFRLKRTIRKYLNEIMHEKILLRQELDDELEKELGETGFKRLPQLASDYIYSVPGKRQGKMVQIPKIKKEGVIADHIDVRLFGILFPVEAVPFKMTGPVQFKMAQSLNIIDSDTDIIPVGMTSLVPNTKDEAGVSKGGSFGNKWIVRYAFLQHHGFVNNNVAKQIGLKAIDVKKMLTAMWYGTDELMTTSKFGQKSRLLIKVNYKDNGYLADLDLMSELDRGQQKLENITHVTLKLDKLLDIIYANKNLIESIEYEYNPLLKCSYKEVKGNFEEVMKEWSKTTQIPYSRIEYYFGENKKDVIEKRERIEAG
jgi:CRISPR-associated protein Csh2